MTSFLKKEIKWKYFYMILICFWALCIIEKVFQNDVFFMIRIGNKILSQGFYTEETFTWHQGLTYGNVKWIFDVGIALIYNSFGFTGIYIFTIIATSLLGLEIFWISERRKCNTTVIFIVTTIIMYLSTGALAARPQIISYMIMLMEIYFIENLLNKGKKRYVLYIFLLSVLMVNVHGSLYPMFLIIFLPYIAEIILSKIPLLNNKNDKKFVINKYDNFSIKLLIIAIIIAILGSFLNPVGGIRIYTDMFGTLHSAANDGVAELGAVVPANSWNFMLVLIMTIGIIGFTKTKVKITDALFLIGFCILSFSAHRNIYYFMIIGGLALIRIIYSWIRETDIKMTFLQKNIGIIALIIVVLTIGIRLIINKVYKSYLDESSFCPVKAADYLLDNYDVNEIVLYNSYNTGAYLEYREIPVFVDSRPEAYFGTSIIEETFRVTDLSVNYNEIFEKYKITHALFYQNEKIVNYIKYDENWKAVYQDDDFILFERIN